MFTRASCLLLRLSLVSAPWFFEPLQSQLLYGSFTGNVTAGTFDGNARVR